MIDMMIDDRYDYKNHKLKIIPGVLLLADPLNFISFVVNLLARLMEATVHARRFVMGNDTKKQNTSLRQIYCCSLAIPSTISAQFQFRNNF
jgi:hypothetical protein